MSAATLAALQAGELRGATRLDLQCGLSEFPPEIFELADTLEVLNLSGNALSALPDELHRLHRLRIFFASDNAFTTLPSALGACAQLEMVGFKSNRITHVPAESLPPQLRWLILTDNAIRHLPHTLGERPRLQKLMLAGNALQTLPESLAQASALALVRLAANRFEQLPPWLLQLPQLAWLAVGGNPLTTAQEARALHLSAVPEVPLSQLQLGELLGQGASGRIHAAHWQASPEATTPAEALAFKQFKGAVTSDGWPASEMAASLAAGQHPGLIPVRGRLPAQDGQGLLMSRLNRDWRPLGGPPSFDSCTRDVYAPGTQWAAATACHLAADVADALAHLHAQGVVHGDLYAHNILWRPATASTRAQALLGDFGAAALPPPALHAPLQALESLAFGHLLDELLTHSQPGPNAHTVLQPLQDWRQACLHPLPSHRPRLRDLAPVLRAHAQTLTD